MLVFVAIALSLPSSLSLRCHRRCRCHRLLPKTVVSIPRGHRVVAASNHYSDRPSRIRSGCSSKTFCCCSLALQASFAADLSRGFSI